MLNSRLAYFLRLDCSSPLIPKLRGQFAEFLNKNYLARLWILSSPTCVRLRYGHHKMLLEAFLGSVASSTCVITLQGPATRDLPPVTLFVLKLEITN